MFGCIETEKEMEKRAIKERKMQMKICCLDVKMKRKKEKTKKKNTSSLSLADPARCSLRPNKTNLTESYFLYF
jgi:hypothetical protein